MAERTSCNKKEKGAKKEKGEGKEYYHPKNRTLAPGSVDGRAESKRSCVGTGPRDMFFLSRRRFNVHFSSRMVLK